MTFNYNNVPETVFEAVFMKLFKCNPENFKFKSKPDGYTAFIEYDNKLFQINPKAGMYEELRNTLAGTVEELQYLNIDCFMKATTGILEQSDFLINLVGCLNSKSEIHLVTLALTVHNQAGEKERTFWYSLKTLDQTGVLLGKAMLEAINIIGLDQITESLLNIQIDHGLDVYNEIDGGLFKELKLHLEDGEQIFYVYTVSKETLIF